VKSINRRRFIELALTGAAGAFLASCLGQQPGTTSVPTPGVSPTSAPRAEANPTLVRGQIVRNQNRPDRNIRYFRSFVPPTPDAWRLAVSGLVHAPLTLTFADIQQLPLVEQVSRMVCVEGWSWKAAWGGFTLAALMEQVKPHPEGQFVSFTCGDGYWEALPVEDLVRDRVLLAYRIDDGFLPDPYGSPLRLILPWKYGYKGPKCITDMEFVSSLTPGYWPSLGPYTVHGDIQPGFDQPQETNTVERITEAGKEVTY
jgi:DMSO/TMAO reductase YedYZ molybdopterin-dependent catalytic subunit